MKNRIIPFTAFALLSLVSCGPGSVEPPASSEKSVTSENKDNIQILEIHRFALCSGKGLFK